MHTFRRLVRAALVAVFVPLLVTTVLPQGVAPVQPPPMINQSTDGLLKSFRFRSIGPASMGGRIDDIAVSESDPNVIYVGYAVGGVFKSDNNGTTFTPVFETYGTASIGDIAIHPTNPNIVYVGTGEANNRQTSSFGDGIYKTTDGGKTFTNMGLKETQAIARIVIDPRNPETVYVASPGHLFVEQDQVHRRRHGVYRYRDRSLEQQHPLCRQLSAASQRLLLQRRRPGQRTLEDGRCRKDLDQADGFQFANWHLRSNRTRRLSIQSERCLRPD